MIKNIKREQIVKRLHEYFPNSDKKCNILADKMIKKCPEELELNVQEWLDHKEDYTEVMVGELSVPIVLDFSPRAYFVSAIIAIGDYDKSGRESPDAYLMRFAIL
jgi:hypothetical protein